MQYFIPCFDFAGIDASKSMIKIAKKYYQNDQATFFIRKANKTKFSSESFDLVICKDTFHHFNKPIEILKEMYRVTKKGGRIYLTDLRRDTTKKVIIEVVKELVETNLVNTRQYIDSIRASYTLKEMKELMKKASINNFKIWNVKINKNFAEKYEIPNTQLNSARNFMLDRGIAIIEK